MATINEAVRISKRILLTNLLTNDYNLFLTPLISGRHGIGKSQVAKIIARDLDGICITIEGGTLKEGEITGIPYQYKNEFNEIEFKFLPYYVIKRIQEAEKILNNELKREINITTILSGFENVYSDNNLSFDDKIRYLKLKKVKPVIIFFDEINRTDTIVFRELMNIILTKTVNGYQLPWWVFIIAAINPSSQDSIYSTNEMDPAQLDRFIKIKMRENSSEWLNYAIKNNFDETLINFIAGNELCLSDNTIGIDDTDIETPSPRGWEMINLVLQGKNKLDDFFNNHELEEIDNDIRTIISSKVGATSSAMYFDSLKNPIKVVTAKDIFDYKINGLSKEIKDLVKKQSTARNTITSKSIIDYLSENLDDNMDKIELIKNKLSIYLKLLDKSSKLLFCQNLIELKTRNDDDVYNYIYEIFDSDIIDLLEYTNINNYKIGNNNE